MVWQWPWKKRAHHGVAQPRKFRPIVECLEERAALSSFQTYLGDFNGDHKQDVAYFFDWHAPGSLSTGPAVGVWEIWLSTGDHFQYPPLVGGGIHGVADVPAQAVKTSTTDHWFRWLTGDVNGDGKDEFVGMDDTGMVSVINVQSPLQGALAPWVQWSIPATWSQLFVADANGDGKADLIGFDTAGKWWVGLSDGQGAFVTGAPWTQWSLPGSWSRLFVGDFTGDGKADVAGFGNNGAWFVGASNGINAFTWGAPWAQWSVSPTWRQVLVGDFNGDGRLDIGGLSNQGDWYVGASNGVSNFAWNNPWAHWSMGSTWSGVFAADVNGDKKADAVGFGFNGLWFAGVSDGQGAFTTGAPGAIWALPSGFITVNVGDFNGDGKADLFGQNLLYQLYVGLSDGTTNFTTTYWTGRPPPS